MKVEILSFQSLRTVELEVEGLTMVVGPSNLGKSALIRAVVSGLYGRGGDDFVTLGDKTVTIRLLQIPGSDKKLHNIEWQKGGGVNKFIIDEIEYDKVGTQTPLILQKIGFREIEVSNEYLRPMVSRQFYSDNMFLLDRSGSFAHDAIARASRLTILLKAERNCSSDLKRQKQLQNIRQADLEAAEARLEAMKPIADMHHRVQYLKQRMSALSRVNRRMEDIRAMSQTRQQLEVMIRLQVPTATPYPEELGQKLQDVRLLAMARKALTTLPTIPPEKKRDLDGAEKILAQIPTLLRLAADRKSSNDEIYTAETSLRAISSETEQLELELTTMLETLKICPVCDRPMEGNDATFHTG